MCELFWGRSELGLLFGPLENHFAGDQVFEVISCSQTKNENRFLEIDLAKLFA